MPYFVSTFDALMNQVRGTGGTQGNTRMYTVAASQSINFLDIVAKTSGANTIEQSIALPGSNSTGTASGGNLPVLGIAMEPIVTAASGAEANTGRTQINVLTFGGLAEAMLRLYNATPGDSQFQDIAQFTPLQFQRWRGASASIWWYSLITTTTNGEIVPLELYVGASITDNYAPIWCRLVTTEAVQQG